MDLYGLGLPLLIFAAVGLLWVLAAARPAGERIVTRFAVLHGLAITDRNRALVAAYLRRAGLLRTLGAWLGFLVPTFVTGLTSARLNVGGWEVVLLGYLAGAAVAEVIVPRPRPPGPRHAVLAPRRLASYLPRWTSPARWALVLAAGGVAGWYAADWRPGAPHGLLGGAVGGFAACAAVALGSELLLRAVVRRRQPVVAEDLLAADHAIRTSSLHALAAASTASQLVLLGGQFNDLGQLAQARGGGGSMFYLGGLVMLALAVAAWSALRQPARPRARPFAA